MGQQRWFYRSEQEWTAICQRLKHTPCPHCKVVGTLIRHGCLRGYDDSNPPRETLRARWGLLQQPLRPARLESSLERVDEFLHIKITAPAASEVTSLFCPKAIPTVAAVIAGALLIPSPRKTVFALPRLRADDLQFLLRGLAGTHLRDPDLFRQVANFRLPVPRHQQYPVEPMPGAQMADERTRCRRVAGRGTAASPRSDRR